MVEWVRDWQGNELLGVDVSPPEARRMTATKRAIERQLASGTVKPLVKLPRLDSNQQPFG